MTRPHDMPPAEHFAHGTRARYVTGCRCEPCRASNRASYHERKARGLTAAAELAPPAPAPLEKVFARPDGTTWKRVYRHACPGVRGAPCAFGAHLRKDSKGGVCGGCRMRLAYNGLVGAGRVRRHLKKLSRLGVGRRAVAAAADVSPTTVGEIRASKRDQLRADLARRILAVTTEAAADRAKVPAKTTLELVEKLVRRGYRKSELARALGLKNGAIQFRGERVTAKTELAVRRLYKRLAQKPAPGRRAPCVCARPLELERDGEILCGRCERPVGKVRAG